MKACPCKDCVERQMRCHSSCTKYKEWRKEYDEQKSQINEVKNFETAVYQYNVQRKRRIYKAKNHSKKF